MTTKALTLIGIIFLTSCSYNSNINEPKKVSLMNYIDKNDLERYGFSPQDIKNFDTKIKNNSIFTNNYESYETNGFTILSSNENPEHIFILKDNKFIASFDEKSSNLYSKETNIPTQLDTLVTYIPGNPSLSYNNGKLSYYDLNLDGIDIFYEVIPSGDKSFDYFSTEFLGTPNVNIIKAEVPNRECKALIGNYACCGSELEGYEAYKFSYQKGWTSIPSNKRLNNACNSNDFGATKSELKKRLFQQ